MKAPAFTLLDQHGKEHSLKDYSGTWLVVYFYPKDDTPGCTVEACSFRDGRKELEALGAKVIGISKDTVKSHAKFATKHSLDFTLLADPEHSVIEAFGSWQLKKFMGREYMGINRDTYLISPSGDIAKKFEGVTPKDHFEEVVAALNELQK